MVQKRVLDSSESEGSSMKRPRRDVTEPREAHSIVLGTPPHDSMSSSCIITINDVDGSPVSNLLLPPHIPTTPPPKPTGKAVLDDFKVPDGLGLKISPKKPHNWSGKIPFISWCHLKKRKLLSKGVYGTVDKGTLKLPGTPEFNVAIKCIHFGPVGQALDLEASTLKELAGAGGTPVLYGMTDTPKAMVMEFIPGMLLHDYVLAHRAEDCTKILGLVKEKVQEIHNKGYIHNDLHPFNIILDFKNETNPVRFIDLGLAIKVPPNSPKFVFSADFEAITTMCNWYFNADKSRRDALLNEDWKKHLCPGRLLPMWI